MISGKIALSIQKYWYVEHANCSEKYSITHEYDGTVSQLIGDVHARNEPKKKENRFQNKNMLNCCCCCCFFF